MSSYYSAPLPSHPLCNNHLIGYIFFSNAINGNTKGNLEQSCMNEYRLLCVCVLAERHCARAVVSIHVHSKDEQRDGGRWMCGKGERICRK